jgi:tetratricopeptide (TPR) repeat protein
MLERWLLWIALSVLLPVSACGPPGRGRSRATSSESVPAPVPEDVYRGYLRGRMAMIDGDYDAAVHAFYQAARAAPREVHIVIALIEAIDSSGDRDQALKMAAGARKNWPSVPELLLLSGELYLAAGRSANAVVMFERATRVAPQVVDAWLQLAEACVADDRRERALEALSHALDLHPDADERAHIQARIRALSTHK